jgi:hypothetical protein
MHDRRNERRLKTLKEGRVELGGDVSVSCVVRDISPAGARLEFEAPAELPGEFRLLIVSAELTIPASLTWQRRFEAGVRFTGVGTAGGVDNSPKRIPAAA